MGDLDISLFNTLDNSSNTSSHFWISCFILTALLQICRYMIGKKYRKKSKSFLRFKNCVVAVLLVLIINQSINMYMLYANFGVCYIKELRGTEYDDGNAGDYDIATVTSDVSTLWKLFKTYFIPIDKPYIVTIEGNTGTKKAKGSDIVQASVISQNASSLTAQDVTLYWVYGDVAYKVNATGLIDKNKVYKIVYALDSLDNAQKEANIPLGYSEVCLECYIIELQDK